MMNSEESGMLTLPRPVPISCVSDLLIPAFIRLIACVLSTICARADTASVPSAIRQTACITSVDKKLRRVRSLWRRISLRLIGIFAKIWDKQRVKLDCWVGNVSIEQPLKAPTAQIVFTVLSRVAQWLSKYGSSYGNAMHATVSLDDQPSLR